MVYNPSGLLCSDALALTPELGGNIFHPVFSGDALQVDNVAEFIEWLAAVVEEGLHHVLLAAKETV